MPQRADLAALRAQLVRPADTMPVRAMALISFASAGLLLFGLLINPEDLPVSEERRSITVTITVLAGAGYWIFARHFRVWMLHAIITAGLIWGCFGLSQMDSSIGSAMTILSIFWTCLLIGTIYTPPVARIYGAFIFVGIAVALRGTTETVAENTLMTFGFGLTIFVTMELLSRTSSRLRNEAIHDSLTGLLNRKGLEDAAGTAVRLAMRNDEPLTIVSFDLDNFKAVNDREGHLAGDRLLVSCAEHWSANIRPQDVLARPGGDEFVLLLPGADASAAEMTMRRLTESSPVSFSYGIAVAHPGDSIEAKMIEADGQLIESKAERRQPAADPATP